MHLRWIAEPVLPPPLRTTAVGALPSRLAVARLPRPGESSRHSGYAPPSKTQRHMVRVIVDFAKAGRASAAAARTARTHFV